MLISWIFPITQCVNHIKSENIINEREREREQRRAKGVDWWSLSIEMSCVWVYPFNSSIFIHPFDWFIHSFIDRSVSFLLFSLSRSSVLADMSGLSWTFTISSRYREGRRIVSVARPTVNCARWLSLSQPKQVVGQNTASWICSNIHIVNLNFDSFMIIHTWHLIIKTLFEQWFFFPHLLALDPCFASYPQKQSSIPHTRSCYTVMIKNDNFSAVKTTE